MTLKVLVAREEGRKEREIEVQREHEQDRRLGKTKTGFTEERMPWEIDHIGLTFKYEYNKS